MRVRSLIIVIIITTILVSCGIPSFDYIDSPSVSSTSDSGFTFTVERDSDGYIDGYKLYARYFHEVGDTDGYFDNDDIDISDTDDDSAGYLEDLGYFPVYIVDSSLISSGSYTYDDIIDYDLSVLKYGVDSSTTFVVSYSSANDIPLIMTTGSESYTFLLDYTVSSIDYLHCPGIYSDTYGEDFITAYENSLSSSEVLDSSIYLEFALFNTGSSSSFEDLESLPVYATAIDIQI